MQLRHLSAAFAALILLNGCGDDAAVRTVKAELRALRQDNLQLRDEFVKVRAQLQAQLHVQSPTNPDAFTAYMQRGDEGYAKLRFDMGTLLVNIGEVRARGQGSSVVLNFANPTTARILGLKFKLGWGRVDDDGYPEESPAKVREITFKDPLTAGAWTAVTIVLDDVPPADVRFVRLQDVVHRAVEFRTGQ